MQLLDILTLIAIFGGPVVAVILTRWIDERRASRHRRMDVFRTLMRTRRSPIHPDHVGALNLVEIEFFGNDKVIRPLKDLMQHFANHQNRKPDEETKPDMDPAEVSRRDQKFDHRLGEERSELRTILLHAIAKHLGFNIEQLEIFRGGYTPQGWDNVEFEQSLIRQYFVDLYLGRKTIPIEVISRQNPEDQPE